LGFTVVALAIMLVIVILLSTVYLGLDDRRGNPEAA
jgi:hypothetical protein